MLKPEPTPGRTDWFVHDRFGLFIHWGIYSVAARHEWVKKYEKMTNEKTKNKKHSESEKIVFKTKLIIRKSCGSNKREMLSC